MDIEIYTLSYCPYCAKAKQFFDDKNLNYKEISLDGDEDKNFAELQKKFDIKGFVTAPQIVIEGKRIGGYSDLMKAVEENKLHF